MIFQIHPYAKMAWSVLSVILKVCPLSDLKKIHILHLYVYQTIIDQVNHHKNVRTLLQDIHVLTLENWSTLWEPSTLALPRHRFLLPSFNMSATVVTLISSGCL
jgi:hypothetical protein